MGVLIPHGLISLDLSDIVSTLDDAAIVWRQCACQSKAIKENLINTINGIKTLCNDGLLRSMLFRIRFREDEQPVEMETISQISDAFDVLEECDLKWGIALDKELKDECQFDVFVALINS